MIHTKAGIPVATGYARIVHGGRGDYVEFERDQMILGNMTEIVGRCRFHGGSIHRYFREGRSVDQTMIYEQRRTVVCADYRVGRFYIAPVDLENWGGR